MQKPIFAFAVIVLVILSYTLTRGGADLAKIKTAPAQKKTIESTVLTSGSIKSKETTSLRFLTSGKIAWINLDRGAYVRKGQVVASLNTNELEKRLQEQLNLYLKTRLDFDETGDSQKDKVITDSLKRIAQKAQADLDNSVIEVAIKNLALENARLVSPIDGYVLDEPVVFAASNVSSSDTISRVGNLNKLQFVAEVDEAEIGKIKIGQKAQISLEAFGEKIIEAEVNSITPAAITTSTGATVFEVTFDLLGESNLLIGMNGEAKVVIDQVQDAIVIPNDAIIDNNFIWAKANSAVEKRTITKGLESDLETQLISGAAENEPVVIAGFEQINKKGILERIINQFK